MKMRNDDIKRGYDSRLKGLAALSLKFCFCVFCFTFLPLRLLTSLTDIASANSTAQVGQELSQGSFSVPRDPNNSYSRQLRKADISIVKDQKDGKSKNDLQRIIEQIRSVNFKPQKQTPEPVVVPEGIPVVEPNETVSETTEPKEDEKIQIEPKLPYEPITDQTLQTLKDLSQHPDKLDNPFELGEILFLSANLKEAAVFYQEALRRADPNDPNSARDRAWILFQTGNCLRNDERSAAAKMYGQLITEYPDSPWTDLAKAQVTLISWFLKDEPRKLITELEYAPSEQNQNK
jgi:tetratricopeptide (TPR) repeat protein